jgi:hypothetical protein
LSQPLELTTCFRINTSLVIITGIKP